MKPSVSGVVIRSSALFVLGCLVKGAAVHWRASADRLLDPLWFVALAGANRLGAIGTHRRGWEWASPPWPQEALWWIVFLGTFGLEVVLLGNLLWWWVNRRRRRSGEG